MSFPLNKMVIQVPDLINPSRGMPAYQFDRSVDALDGPVSSGGGGAPAGPYPFDVEITGASSPYDADVRPGTLNGVIPSNHATTFSINDPGTYYVVLDVTVSDGEIASVALAFDASPPAGIPVLQGEPPTAFSYLLGVVIDAVWIRTIGTGSLAAVSTEVYRVGKINPAPGTLPYDSYYTWNIVGA